MATLDAEGIDPIPLEISPVGQSNLGVVLNLPNTVSTGLMTLTLTATTLSASASAQVFVVQGEAAAPTISTVVAATVPGQCATSGTVLTVGPDNGSGVPIGTPVVICDGVKGDQGDPGDDGNPGSVSCIGSDCTVDANLNVTGALTVGGDDVQRVISVSEIRQVADIAALESQLVALRGFRIAPDATVELQLPAGGFSVNAPIRVRHPDADRISIIGNTGNPAAVLLRCVSTCFLADEIGHNGFLDGFTLRGNASNVGVGVLAENGGSIVLGPNMEFNDLDVALKVLQSGKIFADGATISNSRNGISVQTSGFVSAVGSSMTSVLFGVKVDNGEVNITNAIFAGGHPEDGLGVGAGVEVQSGFVLADSVNISDFDQGVLSRDNGSVFGRSVDIDACRVGIAVDRTGTVFFDGSPIVPNNISNSTEVAFVASTFGSILAPRTILNGNATNESAAANSVIIQFPPP